ncbi:MAG: hypothetical protein J5746_06280 [Victivallales bacterium]|nr:hypothetical protein [Victivallales bacterium]
MPIVLHTRNINLMENTPTLDEVKSAAQVLLANIDMQTLQNGTELPLMQAAIDAVIPDDYTNFYLRGLDYSQSELDAIYARLPILYYYDAAFDKVLASAANQQVPEGKVLLMHLYNLGYVVKTPTQCFGIDIHHRQAERLVPHLDFCLVTHNHSDHYTLKFLTAMNKVGKKIYSNFFPSYDAYIRASSRRIEIGDLTLRSYQSDHNPHLPGFVIPFEIICHNSTAPCVIYTSGDSCNPKQLRHKSDEITFHIVHPYVGLDVVEAYTTTVKSKTVLISHLQEFHHRKEQWRWTYKDGLAAANRLNAIGANTIVPLWGAHIMA